MYECTIILEVRTELMLSMTLRFEAHSSACYIYLPLRSRQGDAPLEAVQTSIFLLDLKFLPDCDTNPARKAGSAVVGCGLNRAVWVRDQERQ